MIYVESGENTIQPYVEKNRYDPQELLEIPIHQTDINEKTALFFETIREEREVEKPDYVFDFCCIHLRGKSALIATTALCFWNPIAWCNLYYEWKHIDD